MKWTQQDLDNYHAAMRKMQDKTPQKAHKRATLNEKEQLHPTVAKLKGIVKGQLFTILGQVPAKSNSYRIGGKSFYKSREVILYECSFIAQCKELNRNIQGEFELHMDVYFRSKRSDIDNCLKVVMDSMEKGKVFKNDNQCVHLNIRKFVDKTNPRIEYQIIEK